MVANGPGGLLGTLDLACVGHVLGMARVPGLGCARVRNARAVGMAWPGQAEPCLTPHIYIYIYVYFLN